MLVIGTLIGAGFASGREIVAYFGETPPLLIGLVVGAFVFVSSIIFLTLGKRLRGKAIVDINVSIAGKTGGAILSLLLLLNGAISFSAMLAGTESLFYAVYPIKIVYPLVLGAISCVVVIRGIKGLEKVNLMLIPLLIVVILLVTLGAKGEANLSPLTVSSLPNAFVYTTMNIFLAVGVLTQYDDLSRKQIFIVSLSTAVILGSLLSAISYALSSSSAAEYDMPLLFLARSQSKALYAFALITVGVGIFTTMLTAHQTLTDWLTGYFKSRISSAIVSLLACFMLSLIGFKRVVDYLYPLLGIAGGIYFLLATIYLLRGSVSAEKPFYERHTKIHKGCQHAKNNR